MELHKAGRLDDAALRYREVARQEPRNLGALRLLGSLCMGRGQFAEAERVYRAAIKIDARSADLHVELGGALRQLGRHDAAVAAYRRALRLNPAYAGAHNNLGIVLSALGRRDEAVASYRRAVEIEAGYAEAHYNLGNALAATGRPEEAIASYRTAIAIRPDYADFYCNLGNALRQAGLPDEATVSYLRAIELNPRHAAAYRNLGIVEFEADRLPEAVSHFQRAVLINPEFAEAHGDLGNAFRALGRFDEALAHYNKALAIKPNDAAAHNNLGVALKMLGRIEEALRSFEKAIEFAPRQVLFYAGLADSKRFGAGDRHLAALVELAKDAAALDGEEQIQLDFVLAKALADLGQHQQSFRHLLAGNARKRQQIRYDEAAVLAQFDGIRAIFTPALMQDKAGLGHLSPVPVFIIGMPRSGTSLVEQMLASHPDVFGAGELTWFQDTVVRLAAQEGATQIYPEMVSSITGQQLLQLGTEYLVRIKALAPAAERITDKMPGNFAAAGLIHLALPNARIIHVRRNPIDTCLSCFSTLFAAEHPWAYDLGELGRYHRAYAALMQHWRKLLSEDVMIEVEYEALVTDFEREARRILAHCGLGWDDRCLAFYRTQRPVRTASMVQVRRPVYRDSVGRWRPYRDLLGPLFAALETGPVEEAAP